MGFAITPEYLRNFAPFPALDFLVKIEERPPQFLRQAPADRSFTGAHESNQVDPLCHSEILA